MRPEGRWAAKRTRGGGDVRLGNQPLSRYAPLERRGPCRTGRPGCGLLGVGRWPQSSAPVKRLGGQSVVSGGGPVWSWPYGSEAPSRGCPGGRVGTHTRLTSTFLGAPVGCGCRCSRRWQSDRVVGRGHVLEAQCPLARQALLRLAADRFLLTGRLWRRFGRGALVGGARPWGGAA